MLEGKSGLCQARTHADTEIYMETYTAHCSSDTAKGLTAVLEVQVRNARSSLENILKFSSMKKELSWIKSPTSAWTLVSLGINIRPVKQLVCTIGS